MALDRYSMNWPRVDSCFPITPTITDSTGIRYRYRYIGTYTPLLEVKNQKKVAPLALFRSKIFL